MKEEEKKKKYRPKIPVKTQLKLWLKAGGRCQFKGCNKPLWREGLTLTEGNYAELAHIVSYSPQGSRGDEKLSKELETSYDNFLLLCKEHHHQIDCKEEEKNYPVELLKKWKHEHESRISVLTSIEENLKTKVLIYKEKINGSPVEIRNAEAYTSLKPLYPESEAPFIIDFTNLDGEGASYFKIVQDNLKTEVSNLLRSNNLKISVFALGKIPSLIQLGYCLGNKSDIELFNYLRTPKKWMWLEGDSKEFQVLEEINSIESKVISISISLSGKISKEMILDTLPQMTNFIDISIERPSIDSINSKFALESFSLELNDSLSRCRENFGPGYKINLFIAASCPIAVELGRSFNLKLEQVDIYDLNKESKYEFIGSLK